MYLKELIMKQVEMNKTIISSKGARIMGKMWLPFDLTDMCVKIKFKLKGQICNTLK